MQFAAKGVIQWRLFVFVCGFVFKMHPIVYLLIWNNNRSGSKSIHHSILLKNALNAIDMSNAEIIVRMDERRLNKLEAYLVLQDSSVSQKLRETLTQLYTEYVPEQVRQDIEETIRQERQAKEARRRAKRRIAVIHLHDTENDCHISIDENTDLFDVCCAYHDHIRKKASEDTLGDFAECFGLYQFIDPILYDTFKETLPNAERIQTICRS